MTKKLVGLFASVALLSSGLAMANNEGQNKPQTQSGQQMGGDASGGSGMQGQQGSMGSSSGSMVGQMGSPQLGQKQITGTVVKSSKDKLSLKTDNGIIDFKVDKATKFQDPAVKQAHDLKEGQQVRTSFDIEGNLNVAKSISLDTSTGGSGLDSDTGINQDMGGSGLDQDINKGKDLGGDKGMGGDVGGSGDVNGSGDKGDKTY
jgi:hypothetical protein